MRRSWFRWSVALRILCAVAFMSIGMAHKTPESYAGIERSQSYQLPDGSYADLCFGDHGVKHVTPSAPCDACRLVAGVLLPLPDLDAGLPSKSSSIDASKPLAAFVIVSVEIEAPRVRGPPNLS